MLSVDPEMGVTAMRHGETDLKSRDSEYPLASFSGRLSLAWGDGESGGIPLFDDGKTPLRFRLSGSEDLLVGRQCERITVGRYLVIAPVAWPRKGHEFREPEPCSDPDFRAHFFTTSKDDSPDSLGSIGDWRPGASRSAWLWGESLFESSDEGELFVGEPPRLDVGEGIEWARVGEERPGGWKGQNFRVAERSIAEVLKGRKGRFFLRTYPLGGMALVDSAAFRYWPGLEGIRVNGEPFREDLVLAPGADSRRSDTVCLVGRSGRLRPEVSSLHASLSADGAVRVQSRPEADEVRLLLREGKSEMGVSVHLPRVWWRLSGKGDWAGRTLLPMTRTQFRKTGKEIEVLVPETAKSLEVGLGNGLDGGEYQSFTPKRDEDFPSKRRSVVPLESFRDYAAVGRDMSEACALRLRLPGMDSDLEFDLIEVTPDPPPLKPEPARKLRPRPPRDPRNIQVERTGAPDLKDKVVSINRVTKVVKGGKNLSFSALVVVGNEDGRVGFGLGKAREVPAAIKKGTEIAKKNLTAIPREGSTIAHQVVGVFGAARVLLKPASRGTGVIAGGPARAVIELAGIGDILTKSLGSKNPKNVVEATMTGLLSLRSKAGVAELRGKDLSYIEMEFEGERADAHSK